MTPFRRITLIASVAIATAGAVVLLDAAITVAWKEPVSAVYSSIQQGKAESELEAATNDFAADPPRRELKPSLTPAQRLARAAARYGGRIEEGDGIGRIVAPEGRIDWIVVQGTDTDTLTRGPGHYPTTGLPGQGVTVGIAGHRTTYGAPFRSIDGLEKGDEIVVSMPYGTVTYEVEKTRIVAPTDVGIVRNTGSERLVLTACHPLYSAAQRYAVFGRVASFELS